MQTCSTQQPANGIKRLLRAAQQQLVASPTARLDGELLLAHVLQQPRSSLYAYSDYQLNRDEMAQFTALLARRSRGEPIAYLLGVREFWSLPLTVTSDTLIPRPETELLVELAIGWLRGRAGARIADLGTGSGAIAVALARELPEATIIATDTSPAALTVAHRNADRYCPGRVDFRHGNWCEPLAGEHLDLIVSNPPYVAETELLLTASELCYEPRTALAAGESGLTALTAIIGTAAGYLQSGGKLLLEHGADQAADVRRLLEACGYRDIQSHSDMAGLDRATSALCQH